MLNFKRCATALALTMAAVPVVAQEAVELPETVVINVKGTSTFYRVPAGIAAGLCEVTKETLALIAEDADVIYCTIDETVVAANDFSEFESFEDDNVAGDVDLDDDGIDDASDDDIDGDGILNEEDDDLDGDDILDTEDDDVFDIDADSGDTGTDVEGEVGGEVEGGTEGGAEVEGEAEVETGTGG